MNMGLVLPIGALTGNNTVDIFGSTVFVAYDKSDVKYGIFVSTLHLIPSETAQLCIIIPQHNGQLNNIQVYPQNQFQVIHAEIISTDPLSDLVYLKCQLNAGIIVPSIIKTFNVLKIGIDVIVLSYPFSLIGSVLETYDKSAISALGLREHFPASGIGTNEFILRYQAHQGSSGGGIYSAADGQLIGILRGTLAPPESIKIGNIALGSDTSVTYAVSAHYIYNYLNS
jgi:S1-C subfamily serine protease